MNRKYFSLLLIAMFFMGSKISLAQIETRLATNCAMNSIEVPIYLKNMEDIKALQLKLLFDNELLHLDTTLYHYADFNSGTGGDYRIHASASHDTITIDWSAFYAVSLDDELLLSLVFSETATTGEAHFSWITDECFFKNIQNLNVDATYVVDGDISLPFSSQVAISFVQFTTGCRDDSESGGCKAQAEVNIEGGVPPYQYQWNDKFNQKDSIAIGLCEDPISVQIRDHSACVYASLFDPVIYPAAVYTIVADPEEVYITRPYVDFSIQTDDDYIEKYEWDFGDDVMATTEDASHTYTKVGAYNVSLRTENIDGCDTTVYLKNFEVKELNFCIPNVFTPNGDGINDTWIFKIVGAGSADNSSAKGFKDTGLSDVKKCSGDDLVFADHFKSSHLVVLNRGGNTVYECTNCTDYWDGGNLTDGVYFYVFTWEGEYSHGKEQGNVTILGSKK
jgi:PKD repeat protein